MRQLALLLFAGTLVSVAQPARADFTVTGEARYVDRVFTYADGFTGPMPELPIRKAKVQVVDDFDQSVLAEGQTLDDGTFAVLVPGTGTADIVVRVFSSTDEYGGVDRVQVTTAIGTLFIYSMDSAVFAGWDLDADLDVGDMVAQPIMSGLKFGNPWNLFDLMVGSLDYIRTLGAQDDTTTYRLRWPADLTEYFGSATSLIAEDDGYDDTIILTEMGRIILERYSDSDSAAVGNAIFATNEDPRTSIREAWGVYFAGAVRDFMGVLDPAIYMEINGGVIGTKTFWFRLETGAPIAAQIGGESSGAAIAAALWDIHDSTSTNDFSPGNDDDALDGSVLFQGGIEGKQLIWNALVSDSVATATNMTVVDFWNGLFDPVDNGNYGLLANVFRDRKIRFILDAAEPNNSLAEAFAVDPNGNWSGLRTLYFSDQDPLVPGVGDKDFYEFDLCAGSVFTVETRDFDGSIDYGNSFTDTFVTLRRPDGSVFGSDEDSGDALHAALIGVTADASGLWTAEIESVDAYRTTGSYQLRVSILQPAPGVCPCCPLGADVGSISLAAGGVQHMILDAGAEHANLVYWMLGSATGTSPGFPTNIGTFPLNIDNYFLFTLSNPNVLPLGNSLAVLDGNGQAAANWRLPAGFSPSLAGITWNHAYFVFNPQLTDAVFLSNALPVVTVP